MTIEERIEKHVRDSFYSYSSEMERKKASADPAFKGYIKRMLEEVAEVAKLEERKRIEEALPAKAAAPCRGANMTTIFKIMGFNDCLEQVHSILNSQSK